jgi:energy-coupling factor transporter ATP-binding protein EcfA2
MKPLKQTSWQIKKSPGINVNTSLWKRAPTTDGDGKYLSDFMMFIPGLNRKDEFTIRNITHKLAAVLMHYDKTIVFADLNLKINVLWISHRNAPGSSLEIPSAIKAAVPTAILVAQNPE